MAISGQAKDTLTGVLFVIAAASIFSSIQEFEDAYVFPDRQFMNILTRLDSRLSTGMFTPALIALMAGLVLLL